MEWIKEYLAWAASRITCQGVLVGMIAGAVLTWMARSEWEQIAMADEARTIEEADEDE